MKKILSSLILFLLTGTTFATFNSITDGDPGLAAPIMQNFRHVNFGSVLKPVDTNGLNSSATLDLGTNTVLWKDLYLSGTANVGVNSVFGVNRVGIGTATPTTILDVVGASKFSGNLTVDTDTFFVDSTNNRVGIGTTTPTFTLDVAGRLGLGNITTTFSMATQATIYGSVNNGTAYPFNLGGHLVFEPRRSGGTCDSVFIGSAGVVAVVTAGGNLGIGTTTPTTALDVVGAGKFSSNLTVDTNTLYVDATNHMVGIGTSSPTRFVHINTNSTSIPLLVQAPSTTTSRMAFADSGTSVTTAQAFGSQGNDLVWYTNTSERMRIASSGNVGIGTISPSTTLDVVGAGKFSGNLTIDTNTLFVDTSLKFVGFGTTNPATKVDAIGTIRSRPTASEARIMASSPSGYNSYFESGQIGVSTWSFGQRINTNFVFNTESLFTGTDNVVITKTGKVGIGTTTPATNLDVVGTSQFSGVVTVSDDIYTTLSSFSLAVTDATGFSSFGSFKKVNFRKVGKMVIADFDIYGTSSTTGFTVTVPVAYKASSTGAQYYSQILMRTDAGTEGVGRVEILAGSNTFTFYNGVTTTAASFTASGTKGARGTIVYSGD